jgi:hypothetical protein
MANANIPDINDIRNGLADIPGIIQANYTDGPSTTLEITIEDFDGTMSNTSMLNSKLNMLVPGYIFINKFRIDRNKAFVTLSRTP